MGGAVRVLIAPDSFKGTLGAAAAAAALAEGWLSVRPGDQVTRLPLADGGEGTLDVLAATVSGARWRRAKVTGPGGALITARWLELPALQGRGNGTAQSAPGRGNAAATSGPGDRRPRPARLLWSLRGLVGCRCWRGLTRWGRRRPGWVSCWAGHWTPGWDGSSWDSVVRRPPMGEPGRWARWGPGSLTPPGSLLPPGGGALADLARADLSGLRAPPAGGVTCLTDVTAPLLGPGGAAAVFGPQKGADGPQIARLEAGLARLAETLGGDPAAPGAGAAGRDRLRAGRRLGRGPHPGGGRTGPPGGAGPGTGRRRSGHYRGGTVRRDLADGEDLRHRDRRRRGGRGAGGSGRGPGERRAHRAGPGEHSTIRGTPPNPRWPWNPPMACGPVGRDARCGPGTDRCGHAGQPGGGHCRRAGQPAALAAPGGGPARQRYPGGKFPGLAGDLPGMSNAPDSGRAGARSRHGSR